MWAGPAQHPTPEAAPGTEHLEKKGSDTVNHYLSVNTAVNCFISLTLTPWETQHGKEDEEGDRHFPVSARLHRQCSPQWEAIFKQEATPNICLSIAH